MALEIQSAQEALFIACEMEKRAIRMYERMLMLFGDSGREQVLKQLLRDEQNHLNCFTNLRGEDALSGEETLLLSAQASGILFPGGLTEALRRGAVDTPQQLIAYAAGQEETAIQTYADFAAKTSGEASEAFLLIAREESQHLQNLRDMLQNQSENP